MFIYLCIHNTYMNCLFLIANQSNIFTAANTIVTTVLLQLYYYYIYGINRFKTRQLDWAKVEDTATQAQVEERGFDNEGIYYFCYDFHVYTTLYYYSIFFILYCLTVYNINNIKKLYK